MSSHDNRNLVGKPVLVTGASGGIGLATALGLALKGARVAIAGRDRERVLAAADTIRRGGAEASDVFVADLSSQSEVRRLAAEVLERLPPLDVLVNNVGGYWHTRHLTLDGLERTFALNHLAPFLLTNLLLDRLGRSPAARVVTVSSNAQAMGRIDFDDLQGSKAYSGARAYNQSTLANLLFTYRAVVARERPPDRACRGLGESPSPGLTQVSVISEPDLPGRVATALAQVLFSVPGTGTISSATHLWGTR